jgi:hypothetical protein
MASILRKPGSAGQFPSLNMSIPRGALQTDTDSYLTLIPADHDETYTARMLRRIPRTDVAEYHKLPEDKGLWSGIRARANLHRVRPGKYEIGIDTRIGSACFRTLSKTVIVVGRP